MPVAISAPVITNPYGGDSFTTNRPDQILTGDVPTGATTVTVNGSAATITGTTWAKTVTLVNGSNTLTVTATDGITTSPPTTVTITLVRDVLLLEGVHPPTGLQVASTQTRFDLSWAASSSDNVRGYRVRFSKTAGGGETGYVKVFDNLAPALPRPREVTVPRGQTVVDEAGIRRTVTEEDIRTVTEHVVAIDSLPNDTITPGEPVYFVVTTVVYDPTLKRELESLYSLEVVGEPIVIDTNTRDVVRRTFTEVARDYVGKVLDLEPDASLVPGSVADNLFVNPISDEFERAYFLLDFLNRAQSFRDLLVLDDADEDGISDPVADSPYKQSLGVVLGLTTDEAIQAYIDEAFDKLASRVHVPRKGETAAQGPALLTTQRVISEDVVIPVGATVGSRPDELGQTTKVYSVLNQVTVRAAEFPSYYNPRTKLYEVPIQVQCTETGSAGNLDPGRLKVVLAGIPSFFSVRNDSPIRDGRDQETNRQLAERAELAWVSVDTGTEGGYLSKAVAQPNVAQVSIVRAGNTLMLRDYDPLREKHIGGKVDIYLRSDVTQTVSETFSFVNPYKVQELLAIESLPLNQLRVTNPAVDPKHPVLTVTRLTNVTKGMDYDLTNLVIVGGQILTLDMTIPLNQTIGLSEFDLYRASYTYLADTKYVPLHQPMLSIDSLTGEVSGNLNDYYNFYRQDDPLNVGNSALAQDAVEIIPYGGIPAFQLNPYSDVILIVGLNEESLSRVGVDVASIQVRPEPTLAIPSPPYYVRDVDYEIVSEGDYRTPPKIVRLAAGGIPNGTSVEVSYNAGENFTVTFQTNKGVEELAAEIAKTQHITADVLAKGLVRTELDIEATVILEKNANKVLVESRILSNIAAELVNAKVKNAVDHSDIIGAIEKTPGVRNCVVPLTLLGRRDDSLVVLADVVDPDWTVHAVGAVTVYKSRVGALPTPTVDKGGAERLINDGPGYNYRFATVYQDRVALTQVADDVDLVTAPGLCYIFADGSVAVTTRTGDHPDLHSFQATYYTGQPSGANDVTATAIEYFELGNVFLTFKWSTR